MIQLPEFTISKKKTPFEGEIIKSSATASRVIRQFYGDDIEIYESFFLLLLNRANKTIGYVKISQGGVLGTYVCSKIIAKYMAESMATACIIAHNHPSGVLRPSPEDISVTAKIKEIGKILDCNLFDHIILTVDGHYSFGDEGII